MWKDIPEAATPVFWGLKRDNTPQLGLVYRVSL